MPFDLSTFRSQLQGDGARPNLFEAQLATGGLQGINIPGDKFSFMCRAAQLPGLTIGLIPVFYYGRELKVPGNATYQEWTLTIINDEDFSIRRAFETWQGKLNSHAGNLRDPAYVRSTGYSTTMSVMQYAKDGTSGAVGGGGSHGGGGVIRKYNMIGCWPLDVSPIDVDWGANDVIEEFTVTMAYQWWEVERGTKELASKGISGGGF